MTLFIDMDEVMADTYTALISTYNREFNGAITPDMCKGKEVREVVPHEHSSAVWEFLNRPGFFRNLEPMPDAIEIIRELSEKHEVYVASAAMQFPNSLMDKHLWLDEYFPFIHWKHRILCGNKHILKGDLMIDDRSHNLRTFTGDSFLFDAPHNIDENEFQRVRNWQEIASRLL